MSWVLDTIVLAIIALSVIITAKKGFVKTVFRLLGFVCAILFAFFLSTPVSTFVYDKAVEPALCTTIASTIDENIGYAAADVSDKILNRLPSFVKSNISGIDSAVLFGNNELDSSEIAKEICNKTVKSPSIAFIKVISTIVMFVILSIVFSFLANLLNRLFSFSIIGKVNRTLGGVLGLFSGCAIASLFILAISLIVRLTGGFLCFKKEYIESSYLFNTVLGFLSLRI